MANKADLKYNIGTAPNKEGEFEFVPRNWHLQFDSSPVPNNPIGEYAYFLLNNKTENDIPVRDCIYKYFLYDLEAQRDIQVPAPIIFPSIRLSHYVTLIPAFCEHFTWRNSVRWPSSLFAINTDKLFIGPGIIFDKNLSPLLVVEVEFFYNTNDHRLCFRNAICKIDSKVFDENNKTKENNFIKNTLFPMFVSGKYPIQIDDLSNLQIFDTPVAPETFDCEQEVYDTLINNIDNVI